MSEFTAPDPGFAARVRDSFARQGLMRTYRAELVRVDPGHVDISVSFDEAIAQQHGYFHGGVIGALADTAGGYAGFTLMPAGSVVLTVEYKLNIMAPAKGDLLTARGFVVRSGRTLTVTQAEVFVSADGRETHCATMLQTLMRLEEGASRPAG